MKMRFFEFFPSLCFLIVIRLSLAAGSGAQNVSLHEVLGLFLSGISNERCSKSTQFRCKDNTCIDVVLLCDGVVNCMDGSDEDNCDFIKCRAPNYFKCEDTRCIQANLLCNGHLDCSNGEDEANCDKKVLPSRGCLSSEYQCRNGDCIPNRWACDGKQDCGDNSDETVGCDTKRCERDQFQCKNKRCIPLHFRCDNLNDCGDTSDEEHCEHPVLDLTNCTMSMGKFPCRDRLRCIEMSKVCDKANDCIDGSDEGGACLKPDSIACSNCSHDCRVTPNGAYCLCHEGYWIDQHNVCHDINECETYGICDQKCINSKGSYSCACEFPYVLQQDKATCSFPGEKVAILLYTSSAGIGGLYLRNRRNFTMGENLKHSTGVAAAKRDIYWTVTTDESQAIVKASLDDYTPRMIVTSGLGHPEDLDVDWITGNIYFTDSAFKHIGVCTGDGQVCTILFNHDIDKPRAISLSPENGLLFWSDWGKKPMIAKSGMDGSQVVEFVTEDIHWPNGITTDTPNSRLYWVDAKLQRIESITFEGDDRRIILADSVKSPFAISVFENKLYWSSAEGNEISECNKFTGKDKKSLLRDLKNRLYGVHVHHPMHNTEKFENPCAGNKCSDMCLLAPPSSTNKNLTFTCACPDDKELSGNSRWCAVKENPKYFLASFRNSILVIEHEHLGQPKINKFSLDVQSISSMTYNSLSGDIIVIDSKSEIIKAYNTKTEQSRIISEEKVHHVPSLHFDDYGNNLYWCDWDTLTIMLMSLKTLKKTVVFQGSTQEVALDLALVPEEGYMFVAFYTVSSKTVIIDRLGMDGSLISRKRVSETDAIGGNVKLYFDRENNRLFWVDLVGGNIESVNIKGGEKMFHVQITGSNSVVYSDSLLFWTKKTSPNIFWKDYGTVSNHHKHLKLPIGEMNEGEKIFIMNPQNYRVKDSPCHINNGGCAHICLATNKTSITECACETGYALSVNGIDCLLPQECLAGEFRCFTGECIPSFKVCDKHKDCLHGDDEFIESCRSFVCPEGQFLCFDKKKCIDAKLKCDGHFDCNDHSDEICNITCGKGKFRCDTGECIDSQFRCDGKVDCNDGYDERNCHNVTCGEHEFQCKSGQCISAAWYCDGEFDCTDGSDEYGNCVNAKCGSNEFHCTNDVCVDINLTCDGNDDCGDGSDEDKECSKNINVYRQNSFYLNNHTAHMYKVCNSRTEFHCETTSGRHCIPIALRCNGVTNCLYGEDEKNCAKECAHEKEFQCKKSKKCIPEEWLCDHHNDCGDNSDEEKVQCMTKNITGLECPGFRCNDGDCIALVDVCNNIPDCADESDEGGRCGRECKNFGCSHKCQELPTGPRCFCRPGFTLGSDNKTCHDVDECQLDICAQNCTNTPGSFVCSCFSSEYSLRSDHVSCKAHGESAHFVIASLTEINVISNNWVHNSHLLSLPPGSMITAMHVDDRRSHVYTVWDYSSIRKIDVLNAEASTLDIPYVYEIAVDWITENFYYNDARTRINLASFGKSAPAVIYDTRGHSYVLSIAVDPVAGYLFWYESFGSGNNLNFGVIRRAECDGANVTNITPVLKFIAENIVVDSYERRLYWYNRYLGVIVRMNYEGADQKEVLHFDAHVAGFSFFESSIYWASADSDIYPIRKCKIYGLPPRKCEVIKSKLKGIRYFTMMQESRQRNVSNPCSPNPCDDFCVPSPSGPRCLCRDEKTQKSVSCHLDLVNTRIMKPRESGASFATYFAYFIVILLILGVCFMGYYYYKPKSRLFHRFQFYNTSFDRTEQLYTSHASGINELSVSKPGNAFLEPVTEESIENEYVLIGHKTSRESLIKTNF